MTQYRMTQSYLIQLTVCNMFLMLIHVTYIRALLFSINIFISIQKITKQH